MGVVQVVHLGVAFHHAADQFSGLAGGHFTVFFIHRFELHHARDGFAEGAHRSHTGRLVGETALHGAVPLQDLDLEPGFEILPDGGGGAGADHGSYRIVPVVLFDRFVENPGHHAAQQGKTGTAVGAADIPDAAFGESGRKDRLDARADGREQGHGLGVAVGQGEAGVEHVGRLVLPDQLGDDVEHAEAVVADHDALGVAGRARGIDDLHGVAHLHDLLGDRLPGVLFQGFIEGGVGVGDGQVLLRAPGHEDAFHARHLVQHLLQLGEQFAADEYGLGLGVAQQKAQSLPTAARIDGHHDRADDRTGQHAVGKFGMVAHEYGIGVALLQAAVQQQAGDFVGVFIKRSVGQDIGGMVAVFEDQDFPIRFILGFHLDQMGDDGLVQISFG